MVWAASTVIALGAAGAAGVGAIAAAEASKNAANTQANAANNASNAQLQASRESIQYQRDMAAQAQANQQPWLDAGKNALGQLSAGMRTYQPSTVAVNGAGHTSGVQAWLNQQPGYVPEAGSNTPYTSTGQAVGTPIGFLNQPSTAFSKPNTAFSTPDTSFTAPNTAFSKPFQFQADPGYDFRLSEGMRGINNSAAARGGVLSGAALKAASKYNQDFASNEYGNAFNRYETTNTDQYNRYMQTNTTAHNNYMDTNTAAYNRYQTDNTGQYNRDITNQTNQYNRLASLAGVGQTAANQMSNTALQTGQLVGNNLMTTANQISQNTIGAGNAAAAGQIGQANALNGGISSAYNMYQQNNMMNLLAQRNSGYMGSPATTDTPSSITF